MLAAEKTRTAFWGERFVPSHIQPPSKRARAALAIKMLAKSIHILKWEGVRGSKRKREKTLKSKSCLKNLLPLKKKVYFAIRVKKIALNKGKKKKARSGDMERS